MFAGLWLVGLIGTAHADAARVTVRVEQVLGAHTVATGHVSYGAPAGWSLLGKVPGHAIRYTKMLDDGCHLDGVIAVNVRLSPRSASVLLARSHPTGPGRKLLGRGSRSRGVWGIDELPLTRGIRAFDGLAVVRAAKHVFVYVRALISAYGAPARCTDDDIRQLDIVRQERLVVRYARVDVGLSRHRH